MGHLERAGQPGADAQHGPKVGLLEERAAQPDLDPPSAAAEEVDRQSAGDALKPKVARRQLA